MTPNIVLFDVDNTLADCDHRLHYLQRETVDWEEFEDQAFYDLPIIPTILTAQAYKAMGKQIWCWTGRTDRIRTLTESWLHRNGVPFEQLLMKPVSLADEPTELTKLNWLNNSPIPKDRVICAYDDDRRVIEVLRSKGGIQVMQVLRPKERNL